jgi:parvulin-like peptidyl-prolyl isomerase
LAVVVCSLGVLGVFGAACGDDGEGRSRGTAQHGSSKIGGAVVSTVDGHAISIADVQAVMRASSLSAREALDRLQAEQLLMAEAERRGTSSEAIDQVEVRAAVQALLDREAASRLASDSELRAAYERDARFHVPETRTTVHVLARVGDKASEKEAQAAYGVAKKAVGDLRTQDLSAVEARYSGSIDGIAVKTEHLPPVDRNAAFVREYLDGVFSIPAPGVVPEPVRTSFGWHAIRVLEITAARETPFEEAAAVLRGEVSTKKQTEGVNSLLLDLRHATPVELAADLDDKLSLVDGAETFR